MSNSILQSVGNLDVVNATLRAPKVEVTTSVGVANTSVTETFSVADKFHVDKDSIDPVSITGNVVASGIKISNLTIGPAFDFASVSNVGNVTANVIQFANATTGFTTTANVEIGGNISFTSNAQVKVDSNVVAEYTGPHPREPKEIPIKKYPEIAFVASKLDRNDTTNTYTQAGYTVSSSSFYTGQEPYRAFDSSGVGGGVVTWTTDSLTNLYGGVDGLYGTVRTSNLGVDSGGASTPQGGTRQNGEWIKIQMPNKIIVSHISISRVSDDTTASPEDFQLYGSNDGTTWVQILSKTGESPSATGTPYTLSSTPIAYKYFGLVVTRTTGRTNYMTINDLVFYGSEEPSETVGDLSLDTTLKSTFNSVRSNNYVMYFDGEDPTGDPVVPKYLPSGTVKTITPNNITFDASNNCWSLDGSTESNVTTADLGFEGDVPHTVSMWVNSSNLDANATTQQLFSIGSGYDKSFLRVDDTQIAANTWHNVTYAYQGEGGSKVTYVDGRKIEEVQVEDTFGQYPPFAMNNYEQGGFKVTTSMELNQTSTHDDAYKMFNRVNDNTSYWTPVTGGAYSTSDGSYVVPTTGAGWSQPNWHFLTNGVAGHWVQIKMPYKIKVDYVKLASSSITNRQAKDATIFGSNDDGKTWYTVGSWAGNTANNFDFQTFIMDTSEYYDTYRMVVTRSGNADTITLSELQFFGHKEGDLTRFPEPTRVLKYPDIAMTGPAQRGYVVTTNTELASTTAAWKAFDGNDSVHWQTANSTFGTSGDFSAVSGQTFAGYTGHWVKLELPHKIQLTRFKMKQFNHANQQPKDYVLLGSNNDSSWTLIHAETAANMPGGVGSGTEDVTSFSAGTPAAYKYIKLLVQKLEGSSGSSAGYMTIDEIEYYGTQEDTQTPAIVGGPFAGKVANFRVYDKYLGEERIQEIYDAQKDAFGHKKSSMTLYKGRIGVGTTEPEGALTVVDEPHALGKFPARAVSSDDSYVEGEGEFVIRAGDGSGYQAFDGLASTSWASTPTRHTRLSEEVDLGAWLKIESQDPISLKKADIESNPSWRQVGSATYGGSIESTTAGNNFGRAVAVSHDGTRVIVGGYPDNSFRGKVQVFDWNGSTWEQVGQTLTGDNTSDHFGIGVAISGDGNIIAVGAAFEDISSKTDCGSVRVYYLYTNTWTILPDNGNTHTGSATTGHQHMFIGETASGELGFAGGIKLSYDGKTILMSERLYDSGGITNRGRIRAYTYANGAWSTKGNEFLGSYAEESFGRAVDMSEDGNHIIIGTKHEGGTGQPPRVEVHRWNGSAWVQKGQGLGREVGWGDGFGPAVTISNDGNTIAIGILFADVAEGGTGTNSGAVDVYHWNASTSLWGPNGSAAYPAENETSAAAVQARLTAGHKLTKVLDKIDNTRFGDSVSLSGDGKRLIVSESHSDYEVANSGRLYTYEYTGTDWILRELRHPANELGDKIGADGRSSAYLGMGVHHAGQGLAISRDGSTIVGGEHYYATNGQTGAGAVRVFQMPSNIKSIWGSNDDVNWTKITTAPAREEATSNVAGFAFGYDDRVEIKNIDNPNYYKYHAIVTDAFTRLKDVKLFGVRKQVSSTLHDGQLTLTKNLDVPRIGPALDADDTPRRDRLIVEYTTSTNPSEDGAVRDTSGRGNHGIMTGSVYNINQKALEFVNSPSATNPAATSYITRTDLGNVEGGNFNHSVSLWFKLSTAPSSVWRAIFEMGPSPRVNTKDIGLYVTSDANNWLGFASGGSTLYGGGAPSGVIVGTYYHIVIVYDGAKKYIYVDGTLSNSGTYTTFNGARNMTLQMGRNNASGLNEGIDGCVSNFKAYINHALTPQEVKTLYDMGRCDEGHHTMNFSKTRVGIGLGDGEVPKGVLDVRGNLYVNNNFVPGRYVGFSLYAKTSVSAGVVTVWDGVYCKSQEFAGLPNTTGFYRIPYTGKYLFTFYGLFGATSNMTLYKNSSASTTGGSSTKHIPYHDKGSGEGTWMQVVGSGVDDFAAGQFVYMICTGALYGQASSPHNGFSLTFLGA